MIKKKHKLHCDSFSVAKGREKKLNWVFRRGIETNSGHRSFGRNMSACQSTGKYLKYYTFKQLHFTVIPPRQGVPSVLGLLLLLKANQKLEPVPSCFMFWAWGKTNRQESSCRGKNGGCENMFPSFSSFQA